VVALVMVAFGLFRRLPTPALARPPGQDAGHPEGQYGSCVTERPKYGVDGFPYLIGLLGGGAVLLATGIVGAAVSTGPRRALGVIAAGVGAVALVPGMLGLRYVRSGKLAHRDRMLGLVPWSGNEIVLDIGCGAGLLAVGAAKRAPSGRVVAGDLWIAKDLSGNGIARTRRNAELEGVHDRIEVRTEDVRSLTLGDASIDVVLSCLCLHNIADPADRERAIGEVARVLRPGGRLVISDLAGIDDYRDWLAERGVGDLVITSAPATFPPQRILTGVKKP
jgi:arsenite methyltransferase